MENLLNQKVGQGVGISSPVEVSPESRSKFEPKLLVGFAILLGIGLFSGWLLSRLPFLGGQTAGESQETGRLVAGLEKGEQVKVGTIYGQDSEAFKDSAQGTVAKNGTQGEGSHRLLREGGDSQTVYLTSSTLDLDLFVDHKVEVWGETFAAQKAGWLMDVGKVKVLE